MANPLRDMSVIMQGLVAAALAIVLAVLGVYLPFSPVAQEKEQLDTLKTIVPEEKETDEFIRLLQGAATQSSVQLRHLAAKAVLPKDNNYYEMPFEVQADGPYFNVLDFFGRLSRLSRIINVGDLQFTDASKGTGYAMRPGTTVTGTFTATTYFTKPADAAASGAKPGAKN